MKEGMCSTNFNDDARFVVRGRDIGKGIDTVGTRASPLTLQECTIDVQVYYIAVVSLVDKLLCMDG